LGAELVQRGAAEESLFLQLDQSVERRPREQARVGVRRPARARLPDAFVGLAPMTAYVFAEAYQHALGLAIEARAGPRELRRGVDDLAVDVELQLLDGGVADAHRARAAVAAPAVQRALARRRIAVDVVQDLERGTGQP